MSSFTPASVTGHDFERLVKRLYLEQFRGRAEPVNGVSGDWGCDLVIRDEGMIVQVYGPEPGPYTTYTFDDRVRQKIRNEARKITKNLTALNELFGHRLRVWRLVIPCDPTTAVLTEAEQAFRSLGLKTEVLGETHLTQIAAKVGFDRHDQRWLELRARMRALPDEKIYGSADTLRQLFVTPVVVENHHKEEVDVIKALRDKSADWPGQFGREKIPIVVLGDYGSGKSSLMKMAAYELAADDLTPTPIYVPLKEAILRNHRTLRESLTAYVESSFGVTFPGSEWLDRPKIWILDGFDELTIRLQKEQELLAGLMEEIVQLALHRTNLVVLASRRILFLSNERHLPRDGWVYDVKGFNPEGVKRWIERWHTLHADTILSPDELRKRGLDTEAKTPLVLYMLARLIDTELAEQRPYLRAEIFRAFVRFTSSGRYEPQLGAPEQWIPKAEDVLREIARLVFLHSNNDLIALSILREKFRGASMEQALTLLQTRPHLLLVGHFFRSHRPADAIGEDHIEFCHLSFREFLVADGLLRVLTRDGGDLAMAELLDLSFRPLGDAELGFLEQLICLEPWAMRVRLFDRLRSVVLAENGIEEAAAKAMEPAELAGVVALLPLRKQTLRTLAYFVRATIASRASPVAFHRLIASEKTHALITQLMTYDGHWHDLLDPSRFTTRVLRRGKGGIVSLNSESARIPWIFETMQEWAVFSGGIRGIITFSGEKWSRGFISASESHRIEWDVKHASRSIFCGVDLVFARDSGRFTDCVFLKCQLISLPLAFSAREKRRFERCTFIDTTISGPTEVLAQGMDCDTKCISSTELPVPVPVKRCEHIAAKVTEARQRLDLARSKLGLEFRPWGEFVVAEDSDFERIVFRIDPAIETSIAFVRDETWAIARATEPKFSEMSEKST